ncbi:unnamed protein product [Rangifer tarandus platyrhynchus]|uniref:Uncharacterized protein n=1 Tax=Rangifer tarandus platyrhynchus TaxID=3082113 RepID=A0AC59ZMC0_RANTA
MAHASAGCSASSEPDRAGCPQHERARTLPWGSRAGYGARLLFAGSPFWELSSAALRVSHRLCADSSQVCPEHVSGFHACAQISEIIRLGGVSRVPRLATHQPS